MLAAAQALASLVTDSKDALKAEHEKRGELKSQQATKVLELIDKKIDQLDAEDVEFVDAQDDEPQTSTETERDEATRLNELLNKQLAQFQRAAEAAKATASPARSAEESAAAAAAETAAAAAAPLAQAEVNATADLWLDFAAEPSQLPQLGNPDPEAAETLQKLAALFAAVPWGTQLPAIQFKHLNVRPSFVHTMVGDTIWQACWGERHGEISLKHWFPFKLLNIAKTVVEQYKYKLEDNLIEEGKKKYAEVESAAIKRRKTSATP